MSIGTQLRELESFCDIADPTWWPLFHRVIPDELIEQVLSDTGSREERTRKLSARTMLLFAIAMGLFTEEPSEQVFAAMVEGIRFRHPELDGTLPKKGGSAKPATALGQSPWSSFSAASADHLQRRTRRAPSSSACASWPWTARLKTCATPLPMPPPSGVKLAPVATAPFRNCVTST
jgi:hypothetical protein